MKRLVIMMLLLCSCAICFGQGKGSYVKKLKIFYPKEKTYQDYDFTLPSGKTLVFVEAGRFEGCRPTHDLLTDLAPVIRPLYESGKVNFVLNFALERRPAADFWIYHEAMAWAKDLTYTNLDPTDIFPNIKTVPKIAIISSKGQVKYIQDGYSRSNSNMNMETFKKALEQQIHSDTIASIGECESIYVQGHRAVDLGLSVKWATYNVNASSPTDWGSFYSWGDTATKKCYTQETYSFEDVTIKWMLEHKVIDTNYALSPEDDVVTVQWGESWRLPTGQEMTELLTRCKWEWLEGTDDIAGYKVTGPNGNSIFLPACGYQSGQSPSRIKTGYYWSKTHGSALTIEKSKHVLAWYAKYYGFSARGVTK